MQADGIDLTNVTRTALLDAASNAALMLTTEALAVANKDGKPAVDAEGPDGSMSWMS